MIPRRIIHFWHDKSSMPDVTLGAIQKTMALHRDYEHVMADDDFMQEHIAEHYNKATLALYNKIRIPASRSDLARLMLLHFYGGTYLDCSLQFHKKLDSILHDDDQIVLVRRDDNPRFKDIPEKVNVINGMMSAPPDSSFIHWCILKTLSNLVDGDFNNKVALATGQQVINLGLHKLKGRHKYRYLSFTELRGGVLTITRQPGITNNWLNRQSDGIVDYDYLQANSMRFEKLWSFNSTFVHFSLSCLKMKD